MSLRAIGTRGAIGGLLMLALTAGPALAKCHVPFIRTLDNQTVTGYMFADSNRPCRINMKSSSGPMQSVQIVARAANGSVQANGTRVIYRSRAGYSGRDEFTYARRGHNRHNMPVVKTVRIIVSIR